MVLVNLFIPDDATTVLSIGQSSANFLLNAQIVQEMRFNETASIGIGAGSTDINWCYHRGIVIGDRVENPSGFL